MAAYQIHTSESVSEGHPDKLADQISDALLDSFLDQDENARVAVETLLAHGVAVISGEVTTDAYVDVQRVVRETIKNVGYTDSEVGYDGENCGVLVTIQGQSPDIAMGVDKSIEVRQDADDHDELDLQGAGDQGLMFGFASDDTPSLMPLPIWLAHRLSERLAQVRKEGTVPGLRPDGKTQVTIGYEGDRPVRLDALVLSTQHEPDVQLDTQLRPAILEHVIRPVLDQVDLDTSSYDLFVNPTGQFVVGGPQGDAGLTGRKIIVDTYGGWARHGGGAFSGKDPSKVDRSAAYAMRWVAKNVVAAGLARRCEVQVAYAIGKAHPVGLYVETFGTGVVDDARLTEAIRQVFDLRPAAIIRTLDLQRPIYRQTAAYGHFGRELPDFTWERTDRVDELRAAVG